MTASSSSTVPGDVDLAELQAALMELLAREDITTTERIETIRTGAAFKPFAAYFATMRALDVELLAAVMGYRARRRRSARASNP